MVYEVTALKIVTVVSYYTKGKAANGLKLEKSYNITSHRLMQPRELLSALPCMHPGHHILFSRYKGFKSLLRYISPENKANTMDEITDSTCDWLEKK